MASEGQIATVSLDENSLAKIAELTSRVNALLAELLPRDVEVEFGRNPENPELRTLSGSTIRRTSHQAQL